MDANYFQSLALILCFEFLLFILAFFAKRNDFADVGWGLGFGAVALYNFFSNPDPSIAQRLLLTVILAWSLRLAGYMAWRMRGKAEDKRYAEMRSGWKTMVTLRTFLIVFMLQGFLLWILSGPIVFYLSSPNFAVSDFFWIAIAISSLGLIYESMADWQKSIFKKTHLEPDSFIQIGLFKFSRYPQYFGEITFWVGIAFFPMQLNAYLGFLYAPILLYGLLRFVSGVPLLEKKYVKRKGYAEYAAKTPLLVPKFINRGSTR